MDEQIYNYKAQLERVVDGDTVVVTLDLGLNIYISKFKIRMAYINAPEMSEKPYGEESRQFLLDSLLDKNIIVKTMSDKKDKYGRFLCEVFIQEDEWISVNTLMMEEGKASKYKGLLEEQLKEFIY